MQQTHASGATPKTLGDYLEIVLHTLMFIVGVAATLAIVLGGLRFVTSGGDANQVTQARNTVLYGVVGVVVAIAGYATISFVIDAFSS